MSARYQVLLIDPDPALGELLRDALARAGMEAFVRQLSMRGEIESLWQQRPENGDQIHVVLIDPALSEVSLQEFVHQIRTRVASSRVAVIVLAESADPGHMSRATRAGANAYLVKPVSIQRLVSTIQQLSFRWQRDSDEASS